MMPWPNGSVSTPMRWSTRVVSPIFWPERPVWRRCGARLITSAPPAPAPPAPPRLREWAARGDLGAAQHEGLRRRDDRLHAGAAQAVHRERRHLDRHAALDRGHAGEIGGPGRGAAA